MKPYRTARAPQCRNEIRARTQQMVKGEKYIYYVVFEYVMKKVLYINFRRTASRTVRVPRPRGTGLGHRCPQAVRQRIAREVADVNDLAARGEGRPQA